MKLLSLATLLAVAFGCTSVQSLSVSQIPERGERKNRIKASASRPIIFLIPFGTSHLDEAHERLAEQCPRGQIEGVLSKSQISDYFLTLVLVHKVELEGYCTNRQKKG